jgi:hypothetical protein
MSSESHPYPHLTTEELAARWRVNRFTVSHNYAKYGLRPLRVGKRLLFPIAQIEEVEQRAIGRPR